MDQTPPRSSSDESEVHVSLLDVGVILARKKHLIFRTALLFGVLGVLLTLSAPREYRSSMKVMSELGGGNSVAGGLGSALRRFGLSIPGSNSGGTLSERAIPDILTSREVGLAVAQETFYFPDIGREASLIEYLSQDASSFSAVRFLKSWTIGLPGEILGLFRGTPDPDSTIEEERAIAWVRGAVSTSQDELSGLITIAAAAEDPLVASQMVTSIAAHLRLRVQEVYTDKSRQDLDFIQSQFELAEAQLADADAALAAFQDRNQGLSSSLVLLEQQRLQRDVSFKTDLYSELQAQQTQARIELQQSQPVITTIEAPSLPRSPSGPSRARPLFALLLGVIVGTGLAFLSTVIESDGRTSEERAKRAEIRAALPKLPRWFRA
ncbi:MAG: tyrosine-protein kinase Etk/Wzc [Rhodothermales bacterium]|jgi:tyrosine-protein kinase Etk/Wzc